MEVITIETQAFKKAVFKGKQPLGLSLKW